MKTKSKTWARNYLTINHRVVIIKQHNSCHTLKLKPCMHACIQYKTNTETLNSQIKLAKFTKLILTWNSLNSHHFNIKKKKGI